MVGNGNRLSIEFSLAAEQCTLAMTTLRAYFAHREHFGVAVRATATLHTIALFANPPVTWNFHLGSPLNKYLTSGFYGSRATEKSLI
jgi:hypothetical protein